MILFFSDSDLNGLPVESNRSSSDFEILFLYKELKLPSRSMATGIAFLLNFSSSGTTLFSFKLIIAGVPIVLEFRDVTNNGVFVTLSTPIVSMEFANFIPI